MQPTTSFLPTNTEGPQMPVATATHRFKNLNDPIHERMKNNPYYGMQIMLRSVFGKFSQPTPIEPSHLRGDDTHWLGVPGYGNLPALSDEQLRNSSFPIAKPGITRQTINNGQIIDLGTEKGLYFWEWAQYASQIVQNREDTDLNPDKPHEGADTEYYIHVPQLEEEKLVLAHTDRLKAENYIAGLAPTAWYQLVYLLGTNMENAKPSTVYNHLFSICLSKPEKILKLQDDKFAALKMMFLQLKDQGIIKQDNGVFKYGQVPLGTSHEQVMYWMKQPDNQDLLRIMESEIKVQIGGSSFDTRGAYASYDTGAHQNITEHATAPSAVSDIANLPDLPLSPPAPSAPVEPQAPQQPAPAPVQQAPQQAPIDPRLLDQATGLPLTGINLVNAHRRIQAESNKAQERGQQEMNETQRGEENHPDTDSPNS